MKQPTEEQLTIRPMEEGDSEAVSRLFAVCFSDPWSKESIEQNLQDAASRNLVAVQGEEILGYIGILAVLDEADITNVAVSPKCRRQGIGQKLLTQLLVSCREEGIRHIFLEVRRSNEAALGLYRRAGFQEIGVRKAYYSNPKEDAILMSREDNNSYQNIF